MCEKFQRVQAVYRRLDEMLSGIFARFVHQHGSNSGTFGLGIHREGMRKEFRTYGQKIICECDSKPRFVPENKELYIVEIEDDRKTTTNSKGIHRKNLLIRWSDSVGVGMQKIKRIVPSE